MVKRPAGAIAAGILMISGCNETAPSNPPHPTKAERRAPVPPAPPPGTGPDAKTPFGKPEIAIDPKSVEAAAAVVEDYADLMEHFRYSEAAKLWTDEKAAGRFATQLNPKMHMRIGKLGSTEGAAGSTYTTIPVVLYGDTYSRPATVILRRVNDVPGSTEVQRRWHIERIDWAPN